MFTQVLRVTWDEQVMDGRMSCDEILEELRRWKAETVPSHPPMVYGVKCGVHGIWCKVYDVWCMV